MKTWESYVLTSSSLVGTGSGFLSTLNESMNKDRIHIDIRIEGRFSCWIRLTRALS